MKINGKQFFFNYKPNGYFDSSIGRLAIYSISAKHMQELHESLGEKLEGCDPVKFLKFLIPYICYPINELGQDENKPDHIILGDEDVDKLPENELTEIAKRHLEYESYLYKEQKEKNTKNNEGENVITFIDGDIKHPKTEDENEIQYLHRLYVLQEKEQKEQMARFAKSIIGPAHFSNSAIKSIKDSLALGNSLSKMAQSIKFPNISQSFMQSVTGFDKSAFLSNKLNDTERPDITPRRLDLPQIDYQTIERNRRAPFEDLGKRLDQIIDLSEKTIEFANTNNQMQIGLLSDIKSSGESASNSAKTQGIWTIAGVILTVIVIGLTGFTIWLNSSQSKESSAAATNNTEQVVKGLKDINQSFLNSSTSTNSEFTALLAEMKSGRKSQDDKFNKLLDEQAAVIQELRDQRIAEQRTIEELRQKLDELENTVNNNVPVVENK